LYKNILDRNIDNILDKNIFDRIVKELWHVCKGYWWEGRVKEGD
jgi:hypothetical protein